MSTTTIATSRRASTLDAIVKVGRLHLIDRVSYAVLPWGILAFTFLVNVVIFSLVPAPPEGFYTGSLLSIYIFMIVLGVLSMTKTVPFAFTLGVSRRTYYLGTVGLAVATSAVWAALLTALWAIEGWTDGWGLQMHLFRVPWVFDGPWYQVLLTSFVLLVTMFLAGMWYGLANRRWGIPGVLALTATLVVVVLILIVAIILTDSWSAVGRYLGDLDLVGATGIIALIAVLLGLCGFATIRRITT